MVGKRKLRNAKLGDVVELQWYDAASRDEWSNLWNIDLQPPLITSYGRVTHLPNKKEDWWTLVSMYESETELDAMAQVIPRGMAKNIKVLK